MGPVTAFARTYAQGRAAFLDASAGLRIETHPEPSRGAEGEQLAVDVALLGEDDADALLVVSSGCHGIEGLGGSGAQVALLRDDALRARARQAGVALLFVHALNPWGVSFGRRVTQEGVDLNRNFVDFDRPPPANAGYDQLAAALLPVAWPPSPGDDGALMAYAATHGPAALQAAISAGQYCHPDGLFYGGDRATWSQRTLRRVLRRHATRCRRLAWIDLHTGLGESGAGERIFAASDDDATRQRARAWWGPGITFTEDGSSSSAETHGNAWRAAGQECPQADYAGITLEFGTQPAPAVLQALRLDHWVARRRDPHDPLREDARAAMRHAFFTDTPAWRQAVVAQTREATLAAIAALDVRP